MKPNSTSCLNEPVVFKQRNRTNALSMHLLEYANLSTFSKIDKLETSLRQKNNRKGIIPPLCYISETVILGCLGVLYCPFCEPILVPLFSSNTCTVLVTNVECTGFLRSPVLLMAFY